MFRKLYNKLSTDINERNNIINVCDFLSKKQLDNVIRDFRMGSPDLTKLYYYYYYCYNNNGTTAPEIYTVL